MSDRKIPLPLHLVFQWILTILLVWLMSTYMPNFFSVGGGAKGLIIVASLLTLLNFLLRPVLYILTFPLRIVATIAAMVVANWAFLWVVREISLKFDASIVTMRLPESVFGWLLVAVILGVSSWMMKPTR